MYKYLISGVGGIALGLFGMAAQALVISQSASFNLTPSTLNDTNPDPGVATTLTSTAAVSLDRFDSTEGVLTGVNIGFDTDWNLGSTVFTFSNLGPVSATGESTSTLTATLIDPALDVKSTQEILLSTCTSGSNFCVDLVNDSGTYNDIFDLSAFTLNDFIGTDPLDFEFERTLISNLIDCIGISCTHTNNNNQWSGTVYVDYTYAIPVPEPAILGLLGVGLLGIGASRLGKRRA
jgi:hypothetical protein